ncbi:hypothetical protein, variant [Aphanomyces astaci]|uniref:Thioredoxin domain-containing protein n=1 Tax=Aphanomyces astaci TaxID=112090 RepID=W4GQZ8_APHAT|nr:hypothetical protein, variant [Aphanomyces astaci]ETV82112.1 hypothetical protein, variant [Aphanomyces astaci]|eukprot:XP_009828849.1 hypothetical protein, variant [Aphanomyces astaci]
MAPAFDLFRKVPEDLQTTSVSSGIFTLLTIVVMTYLIVAEYIGYAYSSSSFVSSVVLDSHQEDLLRINFNVSIPAIPCRHLSIDLSDHLGLQFTNITRHIQRISLVQTPDGTLARHKEVFMAEAVAAWGNVGHVLHAGETITPLLDTTTFDEYMTKYDLVLVNYYAPWCPYSQALLPVWEATALQLQDHPEYAERVTMARVDCTQDNSVQLCRRARIMAFPSMMIYMFGRTFTRYIYNGPRNPESLLLFLDLFYRRLNPDGDLAEEVLPDFGTQLGLLATDDSDDDANEGCEVSGALSVQRVPGKLSFKAAAPDTSFDLSHINTSHHVNHFSFGQFKSAEHRLASHGLVATQYPLDKKKFHAQNINITIEHYIKVRTKTSSHTIFPLVCRRIPCRPKPMANDHGLYIV